MNWYKKAQSEEIDEDLYESIKEVIDPNHQKVENRSCESIYDINGTKIRLWIITGGTPALAFEDFDFTERFPKVEKWNDKHWNRDTNTYTHQDKNNLIGPTWEVLPDGRDTLMDYVNRNLPLKKLKDERYANLPVKGRIVSKAIQDKVSKTRVTLSANIEKRWLPSVRVLSRNYKGSPEELILRFPGWWGGFGNYVNSLYKKYDNLNSGYENITEPEYEQLVNLLTEGKNTGAILDGNK